MKKILFLMLLCLPFIAMAQTDPKYLAGAITMDDGKVSFKTEIQAPSLTKDQLYGTMLKWATERFKPEGKFNARVFTPMKMKEPLQQVAKNIWYSPPLHCHWTEPEFIISCLSPAKTENVISK